MEVLTDGLSRGTLQHLQKLEQQAQDLRHGSRSRAKQERMLRALQKAVHQLQERRDFLKVQVANSPIKVLGPVLQSTDSGDEALMKVVKETLKTTDKKTLKDAVTEATKLKQRELSVSYRLTGCTVHKTDGNRVRVRWDTFDHGQYFQPYYAVISNNASKNLHLVKHNLPYFLPIKDLEKDHLNTDMQAFIQVVSDSLNAFVSRRHQVEEAKENCKKLIPGEVTSSNAFNNIGMTLSNSGQAICDVQLIYDDLKGDRPTSVTVHSNGELSKAKIRSIKELFAEHRIADAILQAPFS
ncbi:centromere protein O-like [Lytechinus variegatus]|uniref:centromere protein O-like n=1 Tax=Lytechinus variegatus TaxID=7654 RepID=UPI001BB17E26|nr:centromere protein O-like [Lytechinus variegatus]